MTDGALTPAEQAAQKALARIYTCIDEGNSFLLEAGAGAGKTYSLIQALRYLIEKNGADLLRQHQRVACITYTNVAKDEIETRTDGHKAIYSSTIHSFCWSIIKDFQPYLRDELPNIKEWAVKLEEFGGIGTRSIVYDEFGYRSIKETHVSLHHNDILILTIKLMEHEKFRAILTSRYPVLFIDEYQDSDKYFAEALKTYFLDTNEGPLIGFFGDHWQKIYRDGCGKIEHKSLEFIGKEANFRSVPIIVEGLNQMRPELPQHVKDPNAVGSVTVCHTNAWVGSRRTGSHWAGDLPAEVAHKYLEALKEHLATEGWDFSPNKTKILMLTHNILAMEQGYSSLDKVFPYKEAFLKKEDPHIKFFCDTLEPVCVAYENQRFGEMFSLLGGRTPAIRSHADKIPWVKDMDELLTLRNTETIGAILDHLKRTKHPRLPDTVERKEQELERLVKEPNTEETSPVKILRELKAVSYSEIIALARFLDEKTPFATKHGVKGAEFENVLVVVGRGWNLYNYNQFLEWAGDPDNIPSDKLDAFERNRNLFYVACSRPKKRLAILFTQELSDKAITTLIAWFGNKAIHSLPIINQ